jgi:hypothetical protein
VENPHNQGHQSINKGKSKQSPNLVLEKITTPYSLDQEEARRILGNKGDLIMQMDEHDLADIDIEKLEDAFNKKELQSIPVEHLRKVHKVFIDSTIGATSRLGIRLDPGPNPRYTPK